MADISQVKLPDGTTYNLKDSYVRTNYRALSNNDFDTINVTELNAGDLIVTGAARFLNTINGSISGNAATATKATQDESGNNIKASYASSISISDHTITLKNKNGVSLGTVTVPDNATDNTKLPLAGGTMTGTPKFATSSISEFSGNVPFILGIEAFADGGAVKWKASSNVTVGSAATATSAKQLSSFASILGNSHADALKTYFDENKSNVPRDQIIDFYSSAYGNGSQYMGYFLSGYDTNPYGGFYVAHYNTPYYVGIQSGSYSQSKLGRFPTNPTSGQIIIADGTDGILKSSGYTIAKSVPSNAEFTDTKNTAGSTDTSSKIFLIGATSQAANPQTYSDNEVYTTSGVLTTKSVQVGGGSATMEYSATTKSINFVFAS